MVDVRPSFGLLHSQDDDNTVASMQIKYLGSMELIPKMKLQVSWVWGEGIPQKKLSHTEFSQLYASHHINAARKGHSRSRDRF